MPEFDVVFRGGRVVSGGAETDLDIAVKDGTIAALLAPDTSADAARQIDAAGCLVLPGAMDVHLHCGETLGTGHAFDETIAEATTAASWGGVTSAIGFVWGYPDETFGTFLDRYLTSWGEESLVDFSFHAGVRPDFDLIATIGEAFDRGVNSFKFHMAYKKTSVNRTTDDDHRLAAMQEIAQRGGIAMFHAENGYMIDALEDRFIKEGKTSWEWFLRSRPTESEAQAIHTVLTLSRITGCLVYIPHLTGELGLHEITAAQADGVPVIAETCPQYLTLTNDELERQGAFAKVGPPLRNQSDVDALFKGILDGAISIVASDNSSNTLEKKERDTGSIFEAIFGIPAVEQMVPLLMSEALTGNQLSPARVVELVCENPARTFGLFPKKGSIRVGADADITLYDPEPSWTMSATNQHLVVGWTPWEGRPMQGRFRSVYRRGVPLIEHETAVAAEPGEFLPAGPITAPRFQAVSKLGVGSPA